MSFHAYFDFAAGLAKPITAPKGTLAGIMAHVAEVEAKLNLKREQYRDNPVYWVRPDFSALDDKTVCEQVSRHNRWVRRLYDHFAEWQQNPVKGGEKITPENASEFWHALQMLRVEPDQWTEEFYREEMERLYEVMRGRPTDGIDFGAKPLTPAQAAQVIILFSGYLDTHDIRLDVPKGYDELAASWDGGYTWSTTCGAIHRDDVEHHGRTCRKKECDVREMVRADD